MDHVWLTGVRLQDLNSENSAIVERNENTLTIHIRSESLTTPPGDYAKTLEDSITSMIDRYFPNLVENADEGTTFGNGRRRRLVGVHRMLVHKVHDTKETFDLERLETDRHCECFSTLLNDRISADDLLKLSYHGDDAELGLLIRALIEGCRGIQCSYYTLENDRNTKIRDILRAKRYHVCDQTLCGKGDGQNAAGELDIEIRKDAGKSWTIFEALNHTTYQYWKDHLSKLLKNYNPFGLKVLFLVVYVDNVDFGRTVCVCQLETA